MDTTTEHKKTTAQKFLFLLRVLEIRLRFVAVLVITGFLLNRLNVSITGMEASSGVHYFPRWTEVAVTLSIVGVGFLLFSLAVRYLNVMEPAGATHAAVDVRR